MPFQAAKTSWAARLAIAAFAMLFVGGVVRLLLDFQNRTTDAVVMADKARAEADAKAAEERARTLLLLEVIKQNQASVNSNVAMALALAGRDYRLGVLEEQVRRLKGEPPQPFPATMQTTPPPFPASLPTAPTTQPE